MAENLDERPEFTDAQKEQIRKAYQGLTAGMQDIDLSRLMPSMAEIQRNAMPNLDAIAKSLVPTQNFGVDLAKSLQVKLPKFKLDLPPLRLDYTRLLGPALNFENLGLKNLIDTSSLKVFDKIYADRRAQFESIFENVGRIIDGMLPSNWHGIRGMNQLETLLWMRGLRWLGCLRPTFSTRCWRPHRSRNAVAFSADAGSE
jgi:hypothetical protein